MNANFVTKMEFHIKATLETLQKGITDFQARQEFFKYEIRTSSIDFSNLQAQNKKRDIEEKFKKLQTNTNYTGNLKYLNCRRKLDKIYEQKINGTKVIDTNTVKVFHNFFLNLEKSRAAQNTNQNIPKNEKPYLS